MHVETMNFSGLAKKSSKTEKNDKGKFKKKKRFGIRIRVHDIFDFALDTSYESLFTNVVIFKSKYWCVKSN